MNKITNMENISSPSMSADEAQWRVRVDLAAAHRLCYREGFSEGMFNHLTARVPRHDDRYYQISFGTHWSTVMASNIMEVSWGGEVLRGEGYVERSANGIHAPMHQKIPEAEAVFHTHMPFASALTRLEDQTIKPIGQTEISMIPKICYDDDYPGPSEDTAEGERMVRLLEKEPGKSIVFMANHGIVTIGTIAEAYERMYYIERVAQVQIYAMWTGKPLHYLPQHVIDTANKNWAKSTPYGNKSREQHHFDALKSMLDHVGSDYAS